MSTRPHAAPATRSPLAGHPGGVRYRDLFDAIDQGFCVIEVMFDDAGRSVDYRFLEVNSSFEAQTDLEDAAGKTMRSLRPEHEEHWYAIYGKIALTGEAVRFENRAAALGRWYDVYAFRIGPAEERKVGILFNDITDRKRDQERLALLAAEIDHRARNLMTVVMSMVHITRAGSLDDYKSKLIGRLTALARSQRLLSERKHQAAELGKLVGDELAGHIAPGDERVTCAGPTVVLGPSVVQPVAMTVHELATNATKYGALSVPEGRIEVRWRWRNDGRLALIWSEHDGPTLLPPTRQGTGTRVILRCIDQLNGEVEFDWRPQGLVCEMVIPTPTPSEELARTS